MSVGIIFDFTREYLQYAFDKTFSGTIEGIVSLFVLFWLPPLITFVLGKVVEFLKLPFLALFVIVGNLLAVTLSISLLVYLLVNAFPIPGYLLAIFPFGIGIVIFALNTFETIVEILYLITKNKLFLNFLGYIDFEHYMLYQKALEGWQEKQRKKESEEDDDHYVRRRMRKRTSPSYSYLPYNVWYSD